jgi:hypothetical protein
MGRRISSCFRQTTTLSTVWPVHLQNILLDIWSDRRRKRRLLPRGPKARVDVACRMSGRPNAIEEWKK